MTMFDFFSKLSQADSREKKQQLLNQLVQQNAPEEYIRTLIHNLSNATS